MSNRWLPFLIFFIVCVLSIVWLCEVGIGCGLR